MASSTDRARTLIEAQALSGLLPALYLAWSDGELADPELDALRDAVHAIPGLDAASKTAVAQWLDPKKAPGTEEIAVLGKHLVERVRQLAPPLTAHAGLVELSQRLQVAELGADAPGLQAALGAVERALGLPSRDGVVILLRAAGVTPPIPEAPEAKPSFDVAALTAFLHRTYPEARALIHQAVKEPAFTSPIPHDTAAYRELVLQQLGALCRHGVGTLALPDPTKGAIDLGAFSAAFETLAHVDVSLMVKAGVQLGLFGGSVLQLGTAKHHALLPRIASLELLGCFAMSELGHGSNVRDCETVARYDPSDDSFVIHTPSNLARKEWIGSAARHARMATVFAQLEVGGLRRGVHAILVPIRDERGATLKGVRIEDCGEKMGLNGVDNGRLWFDQVRVPRENLLDRFAQVHPDGTYSSAIASDGKRFFTMLSTLVGGRVSVAGASLSVAKSALTIAIRYALTRRQFGPTGGKEVKLLDYKSHQSRLFVPLARAYAADFGVKYLVQRFVKRSDADSQEVEGLAAGVKAWASWSCTASVQAAREACGGQGYLQKNQIPALKADSDIFTTFEGDNTVLLQLLAKGLLGGYRQQFANDGPRAVARLLLERAHVAITAHNPVASRRTGEEHLRDADVQLTALQFREAELLRTAAARVGKRFKNGLGSTETFNQVALHLQALAFAHVERVVFEQFVEGVSTVKDDAMRAVLDRLRALYGIDCLERDASWFLEHGHFEPSKSKALRKERARLCDELRPDALPLVDAFGIPDGWLRAPIGLGEISA